MKKLIISLIIFLFGLMGAYVASSQFRQEPEISSTLSARSQEYLAEKKEGSNLGMVYLGPEEEKPIGKRVMVDECFSLIVPFALVNERRDKECDYYLGIESPRGNITTYLRREASTDWDSVPGVRMRRQTDWTYEEKIESVGGKEFLTFKKKDGQLYERSAFYRTDSYFLVINLTAYTNENIDGKFEEVLQSVKLGTQ